MPYKTLVKILAVGSITALLPACAMNKKHNDVLIFGTGTTVGVNVAAPIQNAGLPKFSIGYDRLEAVWMPLKPNDVKAGDAAKALNECAKSLTSLGTAALTPEVIKNTCMSIALPANKYVSMSRGLNENKGGKELELDTYSVFASFGGSGALSFGNASGNLAQFFATGIAAQRLAANPTVGLALNAQADESVAAAVQSETLTETQTYARSKAADDEGAKRRLKWDLFHKELKGLIASEPNDSAAHTKMAAVNVAIFGDTKLADACTQRTSCTTYLDSNKSSLAAEIEQMLIEYKKQP